MSFIRTLRGDIQPKELGFTYSHEHIVCRPAYWAERDANDLLLDDKEKSKKMLLILNVMEERLLLTLPLLTMGGMFKL